MAAAENLSLGRFNGQLHRHHLKGNEVSEEIFTDSNDIWVGMVGQLDAAGLVQVFNDPPAIEPASGRALLTSEASCPRNSAWL